MIRLGVTLLLLTIACQEPDKPIRSVVLSGGAYIRINNRQVLGNPRDTTSLAFFSDDFFSIEIRAAGDSLPAGEAGLATLFMIGDAQDETEIGIFRSALQPDRILVIMGNDWVRDSDGSISLAVPGCNWDNDKVFTHIVLTYDGATATVYGNGELLAVSNMSLDLEVSDSAALIGANWGVTNDISTLSNFWYGRVDEVRLWDIVLPLSEMQFRYQNPDKLTRRYSDGGLDPIIGLWRFNEEGASGDVEPDRSGKGNDAVLAAGAGQIGFSTAGP